MEPRTPEMQKKSLIMGKAIVKLSMYVHSSMLTVNIHKARHLFSRYTHDCQPYVQVCLEPDQIGCTKCYTAVSRDAPHPIFNEKFSFETLPGDGKRRVHVSAWNSNGPGKTAEFLGAMSFGLQHMITKNKENAGWFYLLKEDVGRRKHLPALMRSAVYEEFGPGIPSEVTPLMTRRESASNPPQHPSHIVIADVQVHSIPNSHATNIDSTRAFDSVDDSQQRVNHPAYRPQVIASPKQVRFNIEPSADISHGDSNGDLNTDKLSSSWNSNTMLPSSQNPYILQYRREISAVTNGRKTPLPDITANSSVLTGNSSLLQSSFNSSGYYNMRKEQDDSSSAHPLNSTMEYPGNIENNRGSLSLHNTSTEYVQFDPVELNAIKPPAKQTPDTHQYVQETSFNTSDPAGAIQSDIWIDCAEKSRSAQQETEHDSGICDSLSPSPKSEALAGACCGACCQGGGSGTGGYRDLVDTSLTSDEQHGHMVGDNRRYNNMVDNKRFSHTNRDSFADDKGYYENYPSGDHEMHLRSAMEKISLSRPSNRIPFHNVDGDKKSCQFHSASCHDFTGGGDNEYIDMRGYRESVLRSRPSKDDSFLGSDVCEHGLSEFSTMNNADEYGTCDSATCNVGHYRYGNHSKQLGYHGYHQNETVLNRKYSKQLLKHSHVKQDASMHTKIYYL